MASEVAKTPKRSSPVKNGYLIFYNVVSAILWATVLGRTVGANILRGPAFVYPATGAFVLWTQTLMGMDVLHAALGVVRTAVFTTAIQVASRFVLVWAVQHPFPSTCQSPIYSSMLFAWSLTEVIRYSYLALKLSGWEPYAFFWVRYSSYRVLYPVGILSEMGMMWLGFNEARGQSDTQEGMLFQIFLGVCLFLIWPWGAYTMIGHMNKQRRKVMAVDKSQ